MDQQTTIASLPPVQFCGPITRRKLVRFFTFLLTFQISIYFLSLTVLSGPANTFTSGLLFPGAGFMPFAGFSDWMSLRYSLYLLLSAVIFLLSTVGWFATGNVLLPPLTLVLLAALASATAPTAQTYNHHTIIIGLIFLYSLLFCGVFITSKINLKKRNHSQNIIESAQKKPPDFIKNSTQILNLSHQDIKRIRFLLDRALQPVDQFNGFEILDQFQTAAIRYQINFMGYALSMAQKNAPPHMQSEITQAQKNLLQKVAHHRVWKYWEIENIWGNFRFDQNPLKSENIMYTGFCALQMSMFASVTRDTSYFQKNSFQLKHPNGQSYQSSLPDLLDSIHQQMTSSDFALIACEPNWVYPLCNTIGASALKSYAPEKWSNIEDQFRHKLDHEFLTADGRIIPCRSNYTGFGFPVIGGVMPQALPCLFLNYIAPDLAMRQWCLLRDKILNGNKIRKNNFWPIDTGNYGFARATAYATVALAASEMGDYDVKTLCLNILDEDYPEKNGSNLYRPCLSIWGHCIDLMARMGTKNSFKTLMSDVNIN